MRSRCGAIWQILIVACVCCACRRGELPPIPAAAEGDPLWDYRVRADIPQLADVDAVFDTLAPRAADELRGAFLVCRIDAVENPDTKDPASGPDLTMSIKLGRTTERVVQGKSDAWRSTISVAAVDLVRGDRVHVHVWDSDTWSNHDEIDEIDGKFTGAFPLILRSDAMTVECRVMPPDAVAVAVAAQLREADAALATLETLPDPTFVERLELPRQQIAAARRPITRAASYTGWREPQIQERVAREQAVHRAWARRVRARADALVAELPAPGARVALGSTLVSGRLACSDDECTLAAELAPAAGTTLEVWYRSGLRVQLYARDGTRLEATEIRAMSSDGRVLDGGLAIEHGQHLNVTFRVPLGPSQMPPELAAVRLRKGAPVLLRVR